jgi:hypothetical protein
LKVNFTKSECLVTDEKNVVLVRGVGSKDNCCMRVPHNKIHSSTCLISKEDEVKMSNQKLGHLNLKGMKKITYEEAIIGLPKLRIKEGKICGECQIRKQTKMSHKKLQHRTTSMVLELLHMDLMGSIKVERLGGKRYVILCVVDFSRFTLVSFIREKSDTFEVPKEFCQRLLREKESVIVRIRSDHDKEFENVKFIEFFSSEGIG